VLIVGLDEFVVAVEEGWRRREEGDRRWTQQGAGNTWQTRTERVAGIVASEDTGAQCDS